LYNPICKRDIREGSRNIVAKEIQDGAPVSRFLPD